MILGAVRATVVALVLMTLPSRADATWSIVAVDRATGRLVIATATCVSQRVFAASAFKGLMDVQAVIVPGFGVAATQASSDPTRANQALVTRELRKGTHPSVILQLLMSDPNVQSRQFGIVDSQGRFAGFSGAENSPSALDVEGQVAGTQIYYAVQGNILRSTAVVQNAVRAFENTNGAITDRAMAALEAGDAAGGDSRCSCTSAPLAKAPCTTRNAMLAYIIAADPTDKVPSPHTETGTSYTTGKFALFLSVTDENTTAEESPNPVVTLRRRYDAWKQR